MNGADEMHDFAPCVFYVKTHEHCYGTHYQKKIPNEYIIFIENVSSIDT